MALKSLKKRVEASIREEGEKRERMDEWMESRVDGVIVRRERWRSTIRRASATASAGNASIVNFLRWI
jgi:hypothetical protein